MKILAGVDEVGRGSLIGPVSAAAVILNKSINKKLLKDSKSLSKIRQKELFTYIKKNSVWAIGQASIKEIEKINILHASLLAMKRAIKKLKKKPTLVLIDGNKLPELKNYNLKYVIKGDQKIASISAASIIAKISRDRYITALSKKFKNVEILWASVREPYNYIQAKQLGCHIITVPPSIIEKIESFGKSFDQLTKETVKAFLVDSQKCRFKI
jgi:ribonuclease HII